MLIYYSYTCQTDSTKVQFLVRLMLSVAMDTRNTMYFGKWAILLAIFWLLLSGFLKTLLLLFGIVSVVLVVLAIKRMDEVDQHPYKFDVGPKMIGYIGWLFWEILKSSLGVTKRIWLSPKDLTPSVTKLPVKDIPPEKRVAYANSVTLTPGTLSVDLDDKEITVHALEKESVSSIENDSIAQKIIRLWGRK